MKKNRLGATHFDVSSVCVGTSALGSFPAQYGYEVNTRQAIETILRAFRSPMNFIDTSNEYGSGGDSERRIGMAIKENGGIPKGYVLATKVDPVIGTKDFSGARVRKSVEESLSRLGLDRLQLVHFHDPEKITFEEGMAPGGPVEALVDLKRQGIIDYVGVAGGPIDLMLRYVETGFFDACISHNRYTLVDQSAEPLIEECARRGIGFINCAPYGGGMLARGPAALPRYCYAPASAELITRVKNIENVCSSYGVPLAAVALQFSMRDGRVASTVVGMSDASRIEQTLTLANTEIPSSLWDEVRGWTRA